MSDVIWDDDVGRLAIEEHPEFGVILHVEIYHWSVSNYKRALVTFLAFMESLSLKGIDTVYGAVRQNDPKHEKFALMFGWEKTDRVLISPDETLELDLWRCKHTKPENT